LAGQAIPWVPAAPEGMATDREGSPTWPAFGPEATAAGIRSVLAVPLAASGVVGALNLYARYPAAFGVVDRARHSLHHHPICALAGMV